MVLFKKKFTQVDLNAVIQFCGVQTTVVYKSELRTFTNIVIIIGLSFLLLVMCLFGFVQRQFCLPALVLAKAPD